MAHQQDDGDHQPRGNDASTDQNSFEPRTWCFLFFRCAITRTCGSDGARTRSSTTFGSASGRGIAEIAEIVLGDLRRARQDAAPGQPRRRTDPGAGPPSSLLGRTAGELGLGPCLAGHSPRHRGRRLSRRVGTAGRCGRTTFRQGGRAATSSWWLADVSRPLRDEERQAWQRLIRVIGPRDQ